MQPLEIKITLDLSDRAVQILQGLALLGGQPCHCHCPHDEAPESPAPVEEKPAAEPAPEKAPESKEITDEALRAIIKDVRTRTSPAAVRAIFGDFGIKTSIECPMDRRPDLVAQLNQLVKES